MPSSYSSSRKIFFVPFRVFLSFTCALSNSRFSCTFSGKKYSAENNENTNCTKETTFQSSSFMIRWCREKTFSTRKPARERETIRSLICVGEISSRETPTPTHFSTLYMRKSFENDAKKSCSRTPRIRARHRLCIRILMRSFFSDISVGFCCASSRLSFCGIPS